MLKIQNLFLSFSLGLLFSPLYAEDIQFQVSFDSDLVVTVGEAKLTHAEFDAFMQRIEPEHREIFLSDPKRVADAIEGMVVPRQLAIEAHKNIANQINDPAFQATLYQAIIANIAQKYLDAIWEEEKLDNYISQAKELYLARRDLLSLPMEADFTHVLVAFGDGRSELEAMKIVIKLYDLLDEGRQLEGLAEAYSDDPNASQNKGRYTAAKVNQLSDAVAQRIRSLAPGQISQPFQSEAGWHVVQLHSLSRPEMESFEDVKDRALRIAEERHRVSVRNRVMSRISNSEAAFAPDAIDRILRRYSDDDQSSVDVLNKIRSELR